MLDTQFTFQACEDLSAIWDSITADVGPWHGGMAFNRASADSFCAGLQHHLELLAIDPSIGQSRDDMLYGLMSSTLDRYILYYRVRSSTLEVLRVMVQPAAGI